MSPMGRRAVISELRAIAEAAAQATTTPRSEAELLRAHEELRARTVALARTHGLATEEQLAAQFPSPEALREIEDLDLAFGTEPAPARERADRVTEALTEISGWATGARLAFETLEADGERRG
jgi:hypothetical protein